MPYRAMVLGALALLVSSGCSGGEPFGSRSEGPASYDSGLDAEPGSDAAIDGASDEQALPDAGSSSDSAAGPDTGADASPDLDSDLDGASTHDSAADGPVGDATEADAADADAGAQDAAEADAGAQDAAEADAGAQDAAHDAHGEACVNAPFYRDRDGDGYGDTGDHTEACAAPDGWVDVPGDCRDDDPRVHPSQTGYFAEGYPDPNRPAGISFDFDCDGAENGDPGDQQAPSCGGVLVCQGAGYEKASPSRSGPGIDPYCGSNQYTTCTSGGLTCKANTVTSVDRYSCR